MTGICMLPSCLNMHSDVDKLLKCGLLLSVLTISSCKKEELPQLKDEPLFNITGRLNATFVELKAGKNNYYMFTSYGFDTADVCSFAGEFRQAGCDSCGEILKVEVRNHNTGTGINIEQAFKTGYYSFRNVNAQPYRVAFTAIPDGPAPYEANWNFGDGNTSTALNPVHIFGDKGKFKVCLTISYGNNCTSNFCKEIIVEEVKDCSNNFIYTVSGNTVTFQPLINGKPPFYHYFDFGDGTSDSALTHVYDSAGVYTVCLTSWDSLMCKSEICKDIIVNEPGACVTNFTYSSTPYPYRKHFSQVTLSWKDTSGNIYTSNEKWQPAGTYFQVFESSEYLENENGQKTRMLRFETDCNLYRGEQTIRLKGTGTVAVGHP